MMERWKECVRAHPLPYWAKSPLLFSIFSSSLSLSYILFFLNIMDIDFEGFSHSSRRRPSLSIPTWYQSIRQ